MERSEPIAVHIECCQGTDPLAEYFRSAAAAASARLPKRAERILLYRDGCPDFVDALEDVLEAHPHDAEPADAIAHT